MILADDESDAPSPEAVAVFVSANVHVNPPFEPSTKPWGNIEDHQCFLDEDFRPIPPLEQRDLASTPTSTPAQDWPRSPHHSSSSPQDQVYMRDSNRTTQIIPEELAIYELPESTAKGEKWGSDDITELEKEVQRSF